MTNSPQSLREQTIQTIDLGEEGRFQMASLPQLERLGVGAISRLPVSLRIVLESLLRNAQANPGHEPVIRKLASWQPSGAREDEIPFTVGRVVINCAAGIPLLGDLTAIRAAAGRHGVAEEEIGPLVPLDMVLDHTLTVDYFGTSDAMARNMALDFERNMERYRFVKWAVSAYEGIRVYPPGAGILHQLNLETLAPGILVRDGFCFPDSLVGTDLHTCMIAGLGVVGWGVGGIEAQTAVLGLPISFLTPDVIGVNVSGELGAGVTATDLVLHVTELLRKTNVVGKFVEFIGEGVSTLSVPDRATVANMAVEYGATIGYFPVDQQTCTYLRQTGRPEARIAAVETYYTAQGLFGSPAAGEIDYTKVLDLDLASVRPNLAGPKRPQDRIALPDLKKEFEKTLRAPIAEGGYGKDDPPPGAEGGAHDLPVDGDIVIAAITSCTNTSNPRVMQAAGLVAKKAVERGLTRKPWVKTSLTPGSRVVSKYLEAAGLQSYLDRLGFNVAGYSCTTCVGASGPIDAQLEQDIASRNVVAAAVLSGNRNFEARIHPAVRAAFLASPPLVVALSLVGNVKINLETDPLGTDKSGAPVYLKDIWPSEQELAEAYSLALNPQFYDEIYASGPPADDLWDGIPVAQGSTYPFEAASTYLKEPPFLEPTYRKSSLTDIRMARPIAILGDSITTDHISPIGSIRRDSPAGKYLEALGVKPADFNNYGARRMNHEVMVRGTFSNVRLRNKMTPGVEGGYTKLQPEGDVLPIYEAAVRYQKNNVPLVIIAGKEYGTGSARDWAAKGTRLLGVRAVIAESFERIHRSNLIGMGVLPCQLPPAYQLKDLALEGTEQFSILGLHDDIASGQMLTLKIHRLSGEVQEIPLALRIDTPAELGFVRAGGIMPYILNRIVTR